MSERTLFRLKQPSVAAVPTIAITGGFVAFAGLRGVVLAACLLAAWLVLPAPFPFAIGQAAAPIVASFDTPFVLAGFEIALIALLALDASGDPVSNTLGTLAAAGALTLLVVALTLTTWSFTTTVLALCLLVAATSYALHRYGRVRLGLITETD